MREVLHRFGRPDQTRPRPILAELERVAEITTLPRNLSIVYIAEKAQVIMGEGAPNISVDLCRHRIQNTKWLDQKRLRKYDDDGDDADDSDALSH